jgi:hypothetical protein
MPSDASVSLHAYRALLQCNTNFKYILKCSSGASCAQRCLGVRFGAAESDTGYKSLLKHTHPFSKYITKDMLYHIIVTRMHNESIHC